MPVICIKGPNGERRIPIVGDTLNIRLEPGEQVIGSYITEQDSEIIAALRRDAELYQQMEKEFAEEGLLLGDAVAMATKAVGFEPCPSCTRRQEWLNEWHKRGKKFIRELKRKLT